MAGNFFGSLFKFVTWGESHGPAIGAVIDGVPSGIPLCIERVQKSLDARKPGGERVSLRQEQDSVEILSGVYEGKTLGTPISILIHNRDVRSKDYDQFRDVFRPGHADYTYHKKYIHVDSRGGGRASARETAARVAVGSIAQQVLDALISPIIVVRAAVIKVGQDSAQTIDWSFVCRDRLFAANQESFSRWSSHLKKLKEEGDSVGALVAVEILNVPAGLGEPVYDKLNADLAKAMMSINAVKSVEIGDGALCVESKGSQNNDAWGQEGFLSNHAGGILGGVSTGQSIFLRVAFKPTSSIKKEQVALGADGDFYQISVGGRHDPCVGIRGVPVVEAMASIVLVDHFLRDQIFLLGRNYIQKNKD